MVRTLIKFSSADPSLIFDRFKRTGKRSEIFLATKFGFTAEGARGDPEYVREQLNISLKRLGTDYIDLYYQHRWSSLL
jgi:aryl-alcohol dehydrogenase-like predicted oxidoreductase